MACVILTPWEHGNQKNRHKYLLQYHIIFVCKYRRKLLTQFKEFVAQGIIQGVMIPKLENSFSAIDAGVSQVVITLASAINEGSGTVIKK